MLKTLLVLCGALVVSATGLQAQGARSAGAHSSSSFGARSSSFGARSSGSTARPAAFRGGNRYGGGSSYGHHHHGNYGRYYYLGGIPYFYPFGFGFGYPYYYGSYYGGFGDGYGYGYGATPYAGATYNGRIADDSSRQQDGGSLPEAVQRQLAKRGYYKGTVDGQFGPASRSALSRFQKKQGLKETGKIDEPTLEALGFTDQH